MTKTNFHDPEIETPYSRVRDSLECFINFWWLIYISSSIWTNCAMK